MTDVDLLTAARAWHEAGYSVVPSHEDGGKRPFGKWKTYQATRLEWDELSRLLKTDTYSGIGVITGSASGNVEMIEIEGPREAVLEALAHIVTTANKLGCKELIERVLAGCVARSAGGGLHLFIRITNGPALPNTKLATTFDGKVLAETRGEGGFVIVAPTPGRRGHPDGTAYELLTHASPANTTDVTATERDLLHQVFTIALHQAQTTPQTPPEPQRREPTPGLSPWDDYANRTPWADILEPHGWTWAYRAEDGRDHWVRPGKNRLEGTSATTLENGPLYVFSTNTVFPALQGMSKQYVYAHLHHGGDLKAAARALNAAGYGHSGLQSFTPIDPIPDDPEERTSWVRERFPLLNWHDLWDDDTEEEWLAEPLIPKRRLIALYSLPKVGKSLLMLEIAASIANGKSVFGYPAQPPTNVLYVDFENDPRGDIRSRLQAMGYTPDALGNLHYLTFPTMAALDSKQGGDELLAAMHEYNDELAVIDTVSRAIAGEENDNDTWLAFYRHTGLQIKQAQKALVRLDHAGKDITKGQRGGSAKSGDVDAIWRLTRSTETRLDLECEAARFPITEKRITLRRAEGPLRHLATTDTYADKVAELFKLMSERGVPRIADLTIRQMREAIAAAGISFDTSLISKKFITDYANSIPPFHP